MRLPSALNGIVAVPTLTLLSLVGCTPDASTIASTAECMGDDCPPLAQIHEVTSGSAVEVGTAYATAATISNFGPDDTDPLYLGDGTYGVSRVPHFGPSGASSDYYNSDGSVPLDGGNVDIATTASFDGSVAYLDLSFTVPNTGVESLGLDPDGRFSIDASDLKYDDDNNSSTPDVTIGTVTVGEVASVFSFVVNFSDGTLTASDLELLLSSLTYKHSNSGFTSGDRTITLNFDEDGLSTSRETVSVIVNVSGASSILPGTLSLAYTEDDGASVLDGALSVYDNDSSSSAIDGAEVEITSGYVASEDVVEIPSGSLTVVGPTTTVTGTSIEVSSSSTNDHLILTGTDSVSNYQLALRLVTYENLDTATPTETDREVTVTLDDAGTSSTTTNVYLVEVTAQDDVPVFDTIATSSTVSEGTSSVQTVVASDPDGTGTISYSLTGTDAGDFSIGSSSGVLTFASTPNFESPTDADTNNVYSLNVVASDGTSSTSQPITVTVSNVNEAPTFSSGTLAVSVAEGTSTATTVSASDVDSGDTLTYSITGGADSGDFSINASTGALTFVSTPDFENPTDTGTNNTYVVAVQAQDAGGLTASQTITVTVTDVNESPSFTSSASVSLDENIRNVQTVTGTDPEGTSLAFSLSGGADQSKFTINASTGLLRFAASGGHDYENPLDSDGNNTYIVTVRISDGTNNVDQTVTVTLNDLNDESPVITSSTTISVAEGTSTATTVVATDEDAGDTITYSITGGSDSGDFSINASTGALTFVSTPDFENPTDSGTNNNYVVSVTATDSIGNTDSASLSITVTDASDEAPVFTSASTASINENTTSVLTVTTTDADVGDTVTYSISGGADSSKFSIGSSTGALSFSSAPDFENPTDSGTNNSYVVVVRASDGTNTTDQTITVTINDLNDESPVFTSASTATVNENTSSVLTVTATDADAGSTLTYSITGGADSGDFSINSSTGALSFSSSPNYESPADADSNNVYVVTVRATDGTNATTQTITVTVSDLNDESPVFTSASTATVNENVTSVLTVTSTDADAGDTVTYSIVGGADQGDFSINASTGALSFSSAPNYESPADADTNNVYVVTVRATDGNSNTTNQTITVTVSDLNDESPVFTSASTKTVNENATSVLTVTTTDADAGDTVTYSIVGGADQTDFSIGSTTGALSFSSAPDYETPGDADTNNIYVVTVRATDGNSNTTNQTITVTVGDLNDESPVFTSASTATIAEDTTAVLTVTTTDADAGDSVVYSKTGGADSSKFTLNTSTGVLTFTSAPDFENPTDSGTNNTYVVAVTATDGNSNATSQTITVTVTDANDAPDVLDPTATLTLSSITEDEADNAGDVFTDILTSDSGISTVGDLVVDDDGDTIGIAVIAANNGSYGEWEYSLDCSTFSKFSTLSSAVSTSAALLLNVDDCVRYNPDETNGEDTDPTLEFVFWDRTDSGTVGSQVSATTSGSLTSAFSADTMTASISVSDVEDDPVAVFNIENSSGTDLSTGSIGDTIYLDAAASYDPDDDDMLCGWYWDATAGVGSTLSPSAANNAPCRVTDSGVTYGAPLQCYYPSYTLAGGTTWELEVWSIPTPASSASANCTSTNANLQISASVTDSISTVNTAPTAEAGTNTSFPVNRTYTVDSGADASDLEDDDSSLSISWSVKTLSSTYVPYFTLSNTTSLTPSIYFNAKGFAGTGTFSSSITVSVELQMTVTDSGGASSTDTVTLYLCNSYFADLDSDLYADPDTYYTSCSGATAYASGSSALLSSGIAQNSSSGFDCLDSGSVTDGSETIAASAIGEYVYWYEDSDGDGYGEGFDESSSTTYGTPSTPYGDSTTDGDYIPDTCITTRPTGYVLNNDDCNDDFSITTTAGEVLLASAQNPNTTWYNDVDGDLYGFDNAALSRYVVPNSTSDGMCRCQSDCGVTNACTEYFSDGTTEACTPDSSGDCDVVSMIKQCGDPADSNTALLSGNQYIPPTTTGSPTYTASSGSALLSNWVLDTGDCDEFRDGVNEGASEICDAADIDEDCNGYADDDEPDSSGVGSIYNYYADDDGDGYGDEGDAETSCGGSSSSTPRILYKRYSIAATSSSETYFVDTDADCFCQRATASDCVDDDGISCTPTGGAGGLVEVTPTDCYCTKSDCSTICQTIAQEECEVDPAGSCVLEGSVNPDWFYDFDRFDCDDSDDTVYPDAAEQCDGQYNDCNADGYSKTSAPDDEVDYDNDDYVECGYVSGWSDSANAPKIGTDCSPNDANVYPNATNVCDGQYNNCSNWTTQYADTTGECFCNSSTCASTAFCVDSSGDSCTPDSSVPSISTAYVDTTGECFCQDSAGSDLCVDVNGTQCAPSGTLTSTAYFYVDSNADCLCNASGSSCYDLNGFVCTATGTTSSLANLMDCAPTGDKMSPGAPTIETDADGDCFVDCYDTDTVSFTWVGGDALLDINNISGTCTSILDGADCDDTDITVYPGADEVCDGQINDCDTTSLPNDEADNDGDGYVDCDYDSATWAGSGSVAGGNDCDDTYDLTYPGAKETCDSEFNNCNHPLLEDFEGAVSADCFCNSTSSGSRSCVDGSGSTCTPAEEAFVGATEATSPYLYAEVSCYCSAEDCEIDVDEDGVPDCITPDGDECSPTDVDEDGYADDCLTSPTDPSDLVTALALDLDAEGIYSASGSPFDETDDDNDKYVDCEVDSTVWRGSGLIKEGEDCDDTDRRVYPGATELCDGQYNNCNDVDFDLTDVPEDESDDDGDHYVECTYSTSAWVGDSAVISGDDCDDTDDTVYPGATEVCDGQYNDCDASGYSSTGAPSDEDDDDGDGYPVCGTDSEVTDCDDTDDSIYPNAEELCDGQFNDCNHPYKKNFIGAVYEDCFCSTSAGTSCQTAAGATCTPTYGELVQTDASSDPAPSSSFDYISVSCYCPSTSCYTDKDNDGVRDCYTPDGVECSPTDVSPRDAKADLCVEDPLDPTTGVALNIARSALGQEYSEDAPPDEIDNDSDKYVECTFTESLWDENSDPFVIGGDDCDDDSTSNNEAKFVYPGATEYCDGIFNDCNNTAYSGVTAPSDERDSDGDGYVECDETSGITWKRPSTDPELYSDEDGNCFCDIEDCGLTTANCVDTNGDVCTPTLTSTTVCTDGGGGYSDCDDDDDTVYPNAEELCDGQYNNCNGYDSDGNGSLDEAYDPDGSPAGEIDNDGDGFANCDGFEDSDEYDCDDEDDSRYPGAEELCDGQFNDCQHFLIDDFAGAATTGCYCEGTDGDASSCAETDSAGVVKSCSPTDLVDNSSGTGTSDGITDSFVTLSAAVTLGSTDYLSAEVACYCPTSDCTIDIDLDGLSDCFTAGGVRCEIDDYDTDNDGLADNCVDTPLNPGATDSTNILSAESPTSFAIDGTGANGAPPDEYDDDGDRRVECEYTASIWVGKSTVVGGDDCDDVNSWARFVYPGATEFCDGVFNDCDDVVDTYDDRDPPSDESDDDGDSWVECVNDGATWRHPDTDPERSADEDGDCFCPTPDADGLCDYNNSSSSTADRCLDEDNNTCTPTDVDGDGLTSCSGNGGFEDCDDEDGTVYPTADELCDGQYNDCDATNYSATGAPSNEVDNDEDGYVDCSNDEGVPWAGDTEPDGYGDCDDSDDTRFPSAEEVCDGVFNNCESNLLLDFSGVIGGDCYCEGTDGEIDTDGDGLSDCITSAGATCSPKDVDGDNYADHFLETKENIGGINYLSAEFNAACLCPTTTGQIDTDGDGDSNCVDLTGKVCEPQSSSAGFMTSFTTLTTPRTVADLTYYSVETITDEACYCPDYLCVVDLDGNSISDCYTASGTICQIEDIDPLDNGVADNCIDGESSTAAPIDPSTGLAVVIANPTGLSVSGAPPDEVDNDGDRYVECTYTSSIWQGSALVKGGEDCDDVNDNGEARYVYPGANEYCDGVYNNCSDGGYSDSTPPADEVDGDGDGFVDCDPNTGITWKVDATNPNPLFNIFSTSLYDTSDPYRAYYVDEAGTCYCNKQVSEADTTCDGTCITSAGATCTPVGSCSAVGGYSDCLDTIADNGADTHVDAVEICDGQYNDCRDLSWTEGTSSTWPDRDTTSGTGAYVYVPSDERDDDGDSYVECDNFSGTDWLGYGEASVVGGDDCNDTDDTVYPHAPDGCDGIFNDCDAPGLATYSSAVGSDCYCPSTDGSFSISTTSTGTTSSCVDSAGAYCYPTDVIDNTSGEAAVDGIMDTYVTLVDAGGIVIGGTTYYSAEVRYYCESSDCTIDANGDGYNDCADGSGARSTATLTATDAAANCIEEIDTFTFGARDFFASFDRSGDGFVDAPLDELDLDADGYVDCDGSGYSGTGWSDDSVFVEPDSGWDCDSVDSTVYPAATEVCDGQYNDCNSYSSTSAPADETDNDEDGWVECERTEAIPWKPWNDSIEEPNMWHGSLVNDCWCPNADECELALATGTAGEGRCIDEDGQMCAPVSCDDTSSAGALTPGFDAPKADTLVDCDDTDANTFPGAAPMEGNEDALVDSTVMAGIDPWACANDTDGDFYGDTSTSTGVEVGSDCNDVDEDIHPYQPETCEDDEQVDDDCNGDVNSADGFTTLEGWDSSTHPTLYVDEDLDSYGDPDVGTLKACELSDGYSNNGLDCDDTDETVYPGAAEICDQIDQDCDDRIDEPELDPDTSNCQIVYRDLDGDGYGDDDVSECLCLYGTNTSTTNPNDDDNVYVKTSGDCYDKNANIKPLTCNDGTDNDGDGRADEDDEDCQNGYDESGDYEEIKIEVVDGHDNDCDGFIPAVELDCDDDGYMAMVPAEGSSFSGTRTSVFSYGYEYQTYEDLGLGVCGNTPDATSSITCWGTTVDVECDAPTLVVDSNGNIQADGSGLWMLSYSSLSDDLSSKFTGGYRTYSSSRTLKVGDCDDQCENRNPGESEECDQIDNNCSDTDPGTDDDGIPDALDEDVIIAGTISIAEMDLDGDNYLSCGDLPSITQETQYTSNNCSSSLVASEEEDCEILCSLISPAGRDGDEACDGMANICNTTEEDGDADGTLDGDRDDFRECGAWGSAASSIENEELYVVVWLKDVDWAKRGSEAVELARKAAPKGPAAARSPGSVMALGGTDDDMDSASPPPPPGDTAELGVDTADTGAGDGGSGTGSDADEEDSSTATSGELEDFIPLLLPRTNSAGEVIACDQTLEAQLELLLGGTDNDVTLGASRLEAALESGNRSEGDRRVTGDILLEACQREDGFCTVVRATLSDDVDEKTYDEFVGLPGAFSGECEDYPEQWIARAVWQHDRILEARQTVIEWECLRLYGEYCDELDSSSSLLVDAWDAGMPSASRWLDSVDTWWMELDRFDVASAHTETYLTCWGDPRDETDSISAETGGDCDDSDETGASANRDRPEGPDDLIGLFLEATADCSTCLDGIDNNCDGNIDCADPACARCFMGQGVGCSKGDDPCGQSGCAIDSRSGGSSIDRMFAAALVALIAVLYRRRERR